ncbi:hypothetical protein Fmac_018539 [Flemingia macrophylla]|uniref:Peptidase A1 domain-containing protein n=1 Tax=Flemingia macrophylla TaxID=520843 RepID=A0ABD1M5C0_9FABA
MHQFMLLVISFSSVFFVDASENLNGFSIDLIPRHSPTSPLYDSRMSQTELVKIAAMRSIARSKRVDFIGQNESSSPSSIESPIIHVPDHGEYLMRFFLGTPSVERLAIFDTGSDLSWVQCAPCKSCYPQDTPLFDPTQSSTYMDVTCDSQPCTIIPQNQRDCGNSRECIYLHQYSQNSFTIGKLGYDTISFVSTDVVGQGATFPKTVFGCGVYNNFTFQPSSKTNGMVGLGPGPLSLASQLADQISHKFSYCMVPFGSTSTGKLKFGNQTIAPSNGVVSTPLFVNPSLPSYYVLNLEGITIGQKKVLTGQTGGNIIIDSVPILTHLEQSFYADFISSVKEAINVEAAEDAPTPFEYCVRNPTNMDFPAFVFHFTGADVVLDPNNMFVPFDNDLVCMTVLPAKGFSIFGNWAQGPTKNTLKGFEVVFLGDYENHDVGGEVAKDRGGVAGVEAHDIVPPSSLAVTHHLRPQPHLPLLIFVTQPPSPGRDDSFVIVWEPSDDIVGDDGVDGDDGVRESPDDADFRVFSIALILLNA